MLCWAKTLYDSALEACSKTKAYKGLGSNERYAVIVVHILDQAVKNLKALGGSATPTSVPGPRPPIIKATPKPVWPLWALQIAPTTKGAQTAASAWTETASLCNHSLSGRA